MTATSAILTQAQIDALQAAYDAALMQDQAQSGVWREAYDLLYGFVTNTEGEPRTDVPVDPGTWLWLKGARFVNSGEGAFGKLIREYTIFQYNQRYGALPSDALMNKASNNIAAAFLGQWLGKNTLLGASQPNLTQTGIYDAGAAASTVFGTSGGTGDPDNAAGWAGTILFPNLGAPDFYKNLVVAGLANPGVVASFTFNGAALVACPGKSGPF